MDEQRSRWVLALVVFVPLLLIAVVLSLLLTARPLPLSTAMSNLHRR